VKELAKLLERRYGALKLFLVEGNRRAVVVKTTSDVAPRIREEGSQLVLGGKTISPVLTSGAVVNLKKRALDAAADGKVP